MKVLAQNKKASYNYEILEKFEAGLVLTGQEVKSIKQGRMSIKGSYVMPRGNELFLMGSTVPPYQPLNTPIDYNEQRPRKLLLKREQIKYLIGKSKQGGLTLVPLRVYTKNGLIKLEFAVAKGKKKKDKREQIKKRQAEREMSRELKKRR